MSQQVTREEVRSVMVRDLLERRVGCWRPHTLEEVQRMCVAEGTTPRVRRPPSGDLHVAVSSEMGYGYRVDHLRPVALPPLSGSDAEVVEKLRRRFKLLPLLLKVDEEHLMVAGGAVVSSISPLPASFHNREEGEQDVDIFFVSTLR